MPRGPFPVTEDDVLFHIRHVLSKMKKDARWKRAPELAGIIHEEATNYGIDPLVLAVIVQAESTYREGDLRGKLGEVGLTQVWGAARKCDRSANLKTSRGQVRAGACWYAFALERCKTELGALHGYQSGQCHSRAYGPLYRSRLIKKARARIWYRQKETEDLLNPPAYLNTAREHPAPDFKSEHASKQYIPYEPNKKVILLNVEKPDYPL
jgi:hypothetical protein